MIWDSIVEISVLVQKFPSFLLVQRNKSLLYYHDFTTFFVKMCKRREHGGFSQSCNYYIDQHLTWQCHVEYVLCRVRGKLYFKATCQ